ncbi:hypothetical protein BMWSH_2812 [Priestia megaterium WSH-002]|uniref:Uncharacterized protein n=1 Tax=Priestia megaterium (strain WSH-002) TaxID=1006007 RepID=A0A8D4BPD7_PRIMW|nr:hypothetical protein BMWSH_2812 [Priestia megaterium WSH-002]
MLNKFFKLFTQKNEISKDQEIELHEENDFDEVCDEYFIIDEY